MIIDQTQRIQIDEIYLQKKMDIPLLIIDYNEIYYRNIWDLDLELFWIKPLD
jgi:hypothetical protein